MKTLATLLFALTLALLLPACEPPECTPENCSDGCCTAEKECIQYRSDTACGPNGAACENCADGNVCHLGKNVCIPGVMRTRVQPLEAMIVSFEPPDDEEWDSDGSPPDVVVEMRCPSAPELSRTPESTSLHPTWSTGGCEVITSNLLKNPLEIAVIDVDPFTLDDTIGTINYQVTPEDLNLGGVELTIPETVISLYIDLSHTYSEQ
ncbi:hypothetical protein D7V97_07620 [Corallococcus sp. CA053C]|uniref:hypothetical protein n=1 Tax=Corallococcus sp. CA053C TaxID=2316732 RepID=UPI000EA24934|nr:hypothetical protein [Corallococcus sp. CA053C]RKH12730.1 hypothetical protein D7V97_07620 [Corallococcus sp. CA053C]